MRDVPDPLVDQRCVSFAQAAISWLSKLARCKREHIAKRALFCMAHLHLACAEAPRQVVDDLILLCSQPRTNWLEVTSGLYPRTLSCSMHWLETLDLSVSDRHAMQQARQSLARLMQANVIVADESVLDGTVQQTVEGLLLQYLDNKCLRLRSGAVHALLFASTLDPSNEKIRTEQLIDQTLLLLDSTDAYVVRSAAIACATLPSIIVRAAEQQRLTSSLARLLGSDEVETAVFAAKALQNLTDDADAPTALLRALQSAQLDADLAVVIALFASMVEIAAKRLKPEGCRLFRAALHEVLRRNCSPRRVELAGLLQRARVLGVDDDGIIEQALFRSIFSAFSESPDRAKSSAQLLSLLPHDPQVNLRLLLWQWHT